MQPAETKSDGALFRSLTQHPSPALWIVSSGGHLVQALLIEQLIGVDPAAIWITNDVPQARSLLDGRKAVFAPYVAPRDLRGAARVSQLALDIARREHPGQAISTGAAIAGLALPRLAMKGTPATFVESVARRSNHSLTGKIARWSPRVRTLTQYSENADRTWAYEGSVLSAWAPDLAKRDIPDDASLRVFVTLGTIKPYVFSRAVDATLAVLRPGDEVVWQLGDSYRDGLPGQAHDSLSHPDVTELINWADVVITHAGVGSIVDVLNSGRSPVLATRRAAFKEHVDDHQLDIAGQLIARGLGHELSLSTPTRGTLLQAARNRVARA